jgi:uncharacterized protein
VFEIKTVKGARIDGGALVTAFPSVGMVGTIAGSYMADSLKMPRVAYVVSDDLPPAALVIDGVPGYPLRVLGSKGFSILASEFQIPPQLAGPFSKAVLEWAEGSKFDVIVCLEGLMTDQTIEQPTEVRVLGVGSTESARQMLADAGIEQFKTGVITGVSGAMLSDGERLGKPVICLLAEANAMYPDARGAAKLVESVDKLLPAIKIDIKELYEEAAKIEENVKATVERTKELLAARQGQAERLGKSYMYG